VDERHSRGLPGTVKTATDTDLEVMRALGASPASTVSLRDLRSALVHREQGLRDSLWALEAGGLVEVLESPTSGLICLLTDRGRAQLDGLAALGPPHG
jgi:hypothetical protein